MYVTFLVPWLHLPLICPIILSFFHCLSVQYNPYTPPFSLIPSLCSSHAPVYLQNDYILDLGKAFANPTLSLYLQTFSDHISIKTSHSLLLAFLRYYLHLNLRSPHLLIFCAGTHLLGAKSGALQITLFIESQYCKTRYIGIGLVRLEESQRLQNKGIRKSVARDSFSLLIGVSQSG